MVEGLDSDIVKLITAAEDRVKGLTGELAYVGGVLGSGKYDALREMVEGLDSDIVKLIAAAEDRMKGLTGELAYVEGNMTR